MSFTFSVASSNSPGFPNLITKANTFFLHALERRAKQREGGVVLGMLVPSLSHTDLASTCFRSNFHPPLKPKSSKLDFQDHSLKEGSVRVVGKRKNRQEEYKGKLFPPLRTANLEFSRQTMPTSRDVCHVVVASRNPFFFFEIFARDVFWVNVFLLRWLIGSFS
eukprot:g5815.t1